MNKIIDLHIHTNFSDGIFTPFEVIDLAYKNKVSVISITDHDGTNAYCDELYNYAKTKNISIITGVEISTKYNNVGYHILGYNIDTNNEELQERLLVSRNTRHSYLKDISKKLNDLGYIIKKEELDKIDTITKSHIALYIINNPKNNDILLKTFNHIPNKGEFIETIMNPGCLAYVKKESITPREAAQLIRKAGGKVVLAHPVAYAHEKKISDEVIIEILKDINADGIEANYIYVDKKNNIINEVVKWNKIATDNNILATIGSDFHFIDGIHPEIGFKNEEFKLSIEETNNIIDNILN